MKANWFCLNVVFFLVYYEKPIVHSGINETQSRGYEIISTYDLILGKENRRKLCITKVQNPMTDFVPLLLNTKVWTIADKKG